MTRAKGGRVIVGKGLVADCRFSQRSHLPKEKGCRAEIQPKEAKTVGFPMVRPLHLASHNLPTDHEHLDATPPKTRENGATALSWGCAAMRGVVCPTSLTYGSRFAYHTVESTMLSELI